MPTLSEDEFPLYKLLNKLNQPGVETMRSDFIAALHGGDEERYTFALGIQTIALNVPHTQIPGCNRDMIEKTIAKCYDIFRELADKGHTNAAFVCQQYQAMGLDKIGRSGGRSI